MEKSNLWKEGRVSRGLSQSEVAEQFGYTSAQFVSNWERGISDPPTKILKQLAKLYKLNPERVLNVVLTKRKQELELAIYGGKGARPNKCKGISSQKERTMP